MSRALYGKLKLTHWIAIAVAFETRILAMDCYGLSWQKSIDTTSPAPRNSGFDESAALPAFTGHFKFVVEDIS
jgi:hypothetical protein